MGDTEKRYSDYSRLIDRAVRCEVSFSLAETPNQPSINISKREVKRLARDGWIDDEEHASAFLGAGACKERGSARNAGCNRACVAMSGRRIGGLFNDN